MPSALFDAPLFDEALFDELPGPAAPVFEPGAARGGRRRRDARLERGGFPSESTGKAAALDDEFAVLRLLYGF